MARLLSRFNPREKAIVVSAVVILILLSIHAFVIEPYQLHVSSLTEQLEQEKINLIWMKQETRNLPLADNAALPAQFNGSLANLIDQEVKRQNLSPFLSQMTPAGDNQISIRYANIEFNQLVGFIAKIKQKGLVIKDIRISTGDSPGAVDSSLVFEKNA